MTDIYVVSVQRVTRVLGEDGREKDRDYVTEMEFQGPRVALLRFAPNEVAAALGGEPATQDAAHPQAVQDAQRQSEPVAQAEAPKRKRRTNAEIAADKAAVDAGYRDAAHKREMEEAQAAKAEAIKVGDQQIQVPVAEHVTVPPAEPVAAAPPAAPYNPFAAAK